MDFLPDTDPRWQELEGGCKTLYNPLPVLQKLAFSPSDSALWARLWQELYHQGDIGTASYVAVVYLVGLRQAGVIFNWNLYAFIAAIEAQRHVESNSALPDWLNGDYSQGWRSITLFCIEDLMAETNLDVVRGYLSVLAFAKGNIDLGRLLISIDASEISAYLEEH
ncbi:MAG: hypothetical protein NVV72_01580 [Asticcacaulis sp.]|nr:hypothetical protein [Asticcacaulis sp.]